VPRALAAALALLLASCTEESEEACPGEVVSQLAFAGASVAAGQLGEGLDPEPALTDCSAAMAFPPTLAFGASLAVDGTGSAGALCRGDGAVLFGTRIGDRWVVEESSDGAVLGGCDPTCAARSRVVVAGDLDPGRTSFSGALVEQLTAAGGSCGACVLPCAARYALTGAAEAP
jgi:hypothetical protein